jgi:hypothetical protein
MEHSPASSDAHNLFYICVTWLLFISAGFGQLVVLPTVRGEKPCSIRVAEVLGRRSAASKSGQRARRNYTEARSSHAR